MHVALTTGRVAGTDGVVERSGTAEALGVGVGGVVAGERGTGRDRAALVILGGGAARVRGSTAQEGEGWEEGCEEHCCVDNWWTKSTRGGWVGLFSERGNQKARRSGGGVKRWVEEVGSW